MRTIHLTLQLTIDDRDKVVIDHLAYEVRGKHDAPLSAAEVTPAEVVVTKESTESSPNLSEASKNEVLALLLSLGFDVSEGQTVIAAKTAARIKEVVRWVKMKNGVGSPKKLAMKLFDMA